MGLRLTLVVLVSSLLIAGNAEAGAGLCPRAAAAIDALAAEANAAPRFLVSEATAYPSVVVGALSPPMPGAPVAIAERFVDENAGLFAVAAEDLIAQGGTPNAIGRTVRFQQTYEGVPVVGAQLAVVVRRDGSVRIASSSLVPLEGIDVVPVLAADDAIDVARALSARPIALFEDVYTRLVIAPVGGAGLLAWEVHLGAIPGLLTNLWMYVDAQTGALVRAENRIAFEYVGQAFETNPGEFGETYVDPVEVILDVPDGGFEYEDGGLSSGTACDFAEGASDCVCPGDHCVWLSSPLFLARNCPDYHQMIPLDLSSLGLGEMDAHFCSEVQTASADASGEFIYPWEGTHFGLDDLNGTDKFAEVQMFHHVTRIYDYFLTLMDDHPDADALDWEGHEVVPMMATVNFRVPIDMSGPIGMDDFANLADPNGELFPFDNAFFMPGGPTGIPGWERPFDSIVFGQGSMIDFSWDGDVIYHEFAHSVANAVSVGVGQMVEFGDEWGVNVEPGGMSEGYADAFAGFFTNEPRMGEYSFAVQAPRDMMGDDVCPDFLTGEVHYDSLAWSQSLYQAREAAAGTDTGARHLFEQAAFVGLTSVVENQGFAEAALATGGAIEELLGATARAEAEAVFAAHHTDDCPRFMGDDGTGEVARDRNISAPAAVNGAPAVPYVPGIVQYMVTVGEGDAAVNLEMDVAAESSTGGLTEPAEPAMLVLVSEGAPLQFAYDGTEVTASAGALGPYALDAENRFSLVGVTPGEYYVMPVNEGEGRGTLSYLVVSAGDPVADEEGTVQYEGGDADAGSDADADTDADAGPVVDAGAAGGADDGCGCSAAGRGAAGTLLRWITASLFR